MFLGRVADMYDYLKVFRQMGIRVRPDQHQAMQYLERRGYKFLVDFGYDNAVELAKRRPFRKPHA
jgi:hypothetical protein